MATVDVGTLQAILRLRDEFSSQLKTAERSFQDFGRNATRIGAGLTAAVTLPIAAIGAASLKAAMDAVESENLFKESFDGMAGAARQWSEEVSAAVGSNEFTLRKNAATLFVMSESMGVAQDEAFKMSTSLTELAGDMASFYNLPHEQAFQKIQAGLTGEVEPLKRLGILVNENTIKTLAYERGIAKQGEALTEVQKVQARYLAIMDQTSKAQGDLARTLDSPTNQIRIMREQANQLAIEFGTALLPVFADVLTMLRDDILPVVRSLVDWFTSLDPSTQRIVVVVTALAAALGPLLVVLGQVASGIGALIPLFSAMAPAVAGATAALGPFAAIVAGIAGGAALGLWLRENSEGFRQLTDRIGDTISMLSGLDLYNKLQERGREVTEDWTDAQKESLKQFRAMQEELIATAEATEETTEAFREMKDKVVGGSYIPEMLEGIRSQFSRLDNVMVNPVRSMARLVENAFSNMGKNVEGILGSLLGSVGGLVGGIVGQLTGNLISGAIGFFTGLFRDAEVEVNDLRDAFFQAHGGFVAVQQALVGTVGSVEQQDYVKQIFDAQTVDEFNAAVQQTLAILNQQEQAEAEVRDAINQTEQAGVDYAQSLTQAISQLIGKVEELIQALIRVGQVDIPPVHVPVSYDVRGAPNLPIPDFQHGSGGFRDFGRGTPAMLHGVERVQTAGQAAAEDQTVNELRKLRGDLAELPREVGRSVRSAFALAGR